MHALALVIAGVLALQVPAPHHAIVKDDALVWKPLRPGVDQAIVSGDPTKAQPFVMRLRYQDAARIPPHWHPNDEHITVLAGTFALGMGETSDERAATDLSTGGYAFMPARMRHFAWAKAPGTIVQVHGMGPFVINYVNPADDPLRR
jgi:quercetin dioxygenase-like cupin family protein